MDHSSVVRVAERQRRRTTSRRSSGRCHKLMQILIEVRAYT
ncbi:hypothetical protein V3C99_010803 [Haemonchus contortus]|uniref:Uncharacterized protein n=1 Tax=Haemonchus contortus TaxID=6289 RepID=A0A7I4Y9F6_HAECO